MVQTRRKTAAAAQDGAVKENKAEETPAPQTPTKKRQRGRPPKIKNEVIAVNTPSASTTSVVENSELEKIEQKPIDIVPEKSEITVKIEASSDEPSSSEIPSFDQRIRLKSGADVEDPVAVTIKNEPTSPAHPEDPQHPLPILPSIDSSQLPCSSSIKIEVVTPEKPKKEEAKEPSQEKEESMDIANSESDGETEEKKPEKEEEEEEDIFNTSSSSIPLPDSSPPPHAHRGEIFVDVNQKSNAWDRKDDKIATSPLSSPTMNRPKIHFLHPAYSSFASDSAVSPQPPPPPPEPAPAREKPENGVSGAFKMTFKKAATPNLLKTSALDKRVTPATSSASSISSSSTEITAPKELPKETPKEEITPTKRSSNFGTAATSELPPPQMVALPKLSFFNTPAPTSVFSSESDASEDQVSPKSVPFTTPSKKHTDSEIQALIAKAEKVAQSIERRYEEDRHKEKDDYDRRRDSSRDDRDRRFKKTEPERSEPQRRQREDDERRAKEREREVTKRHDREREEERRQKEDEKRKREEEEVRWKLEADRRQKEEEDVKKEEEERKLKEEERKKKEEEKKVKEEEMKVPKYEVITECIYKTRNSTKKRTDSLDCDCKLAGGCCSDSDCVNRAMMTECPSDCPVKKCKNQRFAKKKYAAVEAFHTGTSKGCGLRALKDIKKGRFIIEYVGEVLERDDYEKRKIKYAADKKHKHHYLCDTGLYTIDATEYGNASRFINHSCDPNAICEKWSVPKTPGDISRIGFFAKKFIKAGEEISFDYQFVNYGRDAQQCFCGTALCNGYIGRPPEDVSSDDDDDSDIITSRDIDLDEEEAEKLAELDGLESHEKIEFIEEMLEDLVIKNKKHAKKVITIATRITDHNQRKELIKEIFCPDTSYGTQTFYAQNGMATLMGAWLAADDYTLVNLKLVQVILQVLHGDVFVACAKADSFLLEVLLRWKDSSLGDWVDLHVVTDSLVECTVDPSKQYEVAADEVQKEITDNFKRVKEMAVRLNNHWFNRSVSFKIPKKIREPETKENGSRPEATPSSQLRDHDRNNSSSSSSVTPRNHQSYSNSYYNDRDPNIRFFNNGNDVHQYRFAGYHGNNYKANYVTRKDSYRDRRRYGGRRSRSRSRSASPKRRRYDDRDSRGRSPDYESARGARTPPEEKPSLKDHRNSHVKPPIDEQEAAHDYPQEHIHPVAYSLPYPYANYETPYMYPPGSGYVIPAQPAPMNPQDVVLAMNNFPSMFKLKELYSQADLTALEARVLEVEAEHQMLKDELEKRRLENERLEAIRMQKEQDVATKVSKYQWAKALAPSGETYYYNKLTKETQWHEPSKEQGLVEPDVIETSAETSSAVIANAVGKAIKAEIQIQEVVSVKQEIVEEPQRQSSSHSKSSSPKSNRDRREGSRHRDHQGKNGYTSGEARVKKYKGDLENCIKSVVSTHVLLLASQDLTSDKSTWLIKLIAKEMFKRESSNSGFDYRLNGITEKKVKNYTKMLIDRKLETNDLWKGYTGR